MKKNQINRIIEILLIEDNPGDSRLFEEAFSKNNIIHNLHVASDGQQAYDFLQKKGKYSKALYPDIILLDLTIPHIGGHQLLEFIKTDPGLKRIPVIVLTISENERDVLQAYDHHANCYIIKPPDLDEFTIVVNAILDFWGSVVILPHLQRCKPNQQKDFHLSSALRQ